ncbi:MAG: hypothetical protein P8046_08380 [Anaerolineales bacterium]
MSNNDRKSSKNSNWKKIGELNNLPDSDSELIQSWLETVFTPLNLSSRYKTEIIRTSKMSTARVAVEHAGLDIFTHIALYIPRGLNADGNSWGLFHMERITIREKNQNVMDHNINFYLYEEKE